MPAARANRVNERGVGDATGTGVDERRELLNVGMPIAEVSEDHGRRRAAAQRFGLRKKRNGESERCKESQQSALSFRSVNDDQRRGRRTHGIRRAMKTPR